MPLVWRMERMTPTVMRRGKYRFYFYSREGKRPHVHVGSAEKEAKIWLDPVAVERNYGYNNKEMAEILEIVEENREFLLSKWGEHREK